MRRNRRNNVRRERIVMLASSAFVLAALTMTGLYMKDKNAEVKDDGYTIDFTALENNVEDKFEEIAMNEDNGTVDDTEQVALGNPDDDLDYMPLEAGSHLVEIPGLTMDEADTDMTAEENSGQDTEQMQSQVTETVMWRKTVRKRMCRTVRKHPVKAWRFQRSCLLQKIWD